MQWRILRKIILLEDLKVKYENHVYRNFWKRKRGKTYR